jgi:hypothetical protein
MLAACASRDAAAAEPWRFSAALTYFDVPKTQDFWNPVFTVDHGRLHLEARHNYVAFDTSSFWAGVNFDAGKDWRLDATAMAGAVWGSVDGVGGGYELTLTRAWFTLESQGEYIWNPHAHMDDSLYAWTELTGAPAAWCRLGLAGQRARNYGAQPDVLRGLVAVFSYKAAALEVDALDPDRSTATYMLTLTVTF